MITESLLLDSTIVVGLTIAAMTAVCLIYLSGYHAGWKQRQRELRSLTRELDRLNAGRGQ